MKLNSPREDPYSSMNNALDGLREKGYKEEFVIQDETTATDGEGNKYSPGDLVIDEIHRLTGKKNWFNLQEKAADQYLQIFALNAKNGVKGTINNDMNKEGFDVVETFLQNVDRSDALHEKNT